MLWLVCLTISLLLFPVCYARHRKIRRAFFEQVDKLSQLVELDANKRNGWFMLKNNTIYISRNKVHPDRITLELFGLIDIYTHSKDDSAPMTSIVSVKTYDLYQYLSKNNFRDYKRLYNVMEEKYIDRIRWCSDVKTSYSPHSPYFFIQSLV